MADTILTGGKVFVGAAEGVVDAVAMAGGRIINFRNQLIETGADKLLADSLDEYALARSAWLQRRRLQLFDGQLPAEEDPFAEPADEPAPEPAKAEPPRP